MNKWMMTVGTAVALAASVAAQEPPRKPASGLAKAAPLPSSGSVAARVTPSVQAKVDALLVQIRMADPEERGRIAMNLPKAGTGWTLYAASLFESMDAAVRPFATAVLAEARDPRVLPVAFQALSSKDPAARLQAVVLVASFEDPSLWRRLLPLLGDPDLSVRYSALDGIGRLASPDALETLMGFLADPSPSLRRRALEAAFAMAAEAEREGDLEQALLEALRGSRDPEMTADLVSVSAQFTHPEMAAEIAPFLDDPSPQVRSAAATAMSGMASPETVEALADRLGVEEDPLVMTDVIRALTHLRAKGAVEPLIELLDGEDPTLRQEALNALRNITRQKFGPDSTTWAEWWQDSGRG